MIKLPPQGQNWKVDNASDLRGYINYTQNVDFGEDGYVKFNGKSISVYSSSDDANFGILQKSVYFSSGYFLVANSHCWSVTSGLVFTKNTETGRPTPGLYGDAVVWQGRVYVSSGTSTDVRYWDGAAWTDPSIAIANDNVPHPLEIMSNFSGGNLALADKNTVKLYNTSHSLVTTLTLNSDYTVTCMVYRQNYLYIGTQSVSNGKAKLFVWNGAGTSAQAEYSVDSNRIFSITEYGSTFAIVTNSGELLLWNGGGFDQIAVFPVYNSPYEWDNRTDTLLGKVHMNGMIADGENLYITINGAVGANSNVGSTVENDFFLPNQPSGVWCYNPNNGLYCYAPQTTNGYTTFTASALSSNTLTLSANTDVRTGDPVQVVENGSLTGITDNTLYYAIKVDVNQIKLAQTQADAEAGTAITLGGAVTSATFIIANYTQEADIYQKSSQSVGAVGLIQEQSSSTSVFPEIFQSRLLWGFNDGSIIRLCIQSQVPGVGFFSTAKIIASGIKDNWQKLYTFVDGMFGSYDKLIIRYKTKERLSFPTPPISGTYSGVDAIGSTDNRIDLAEVGDSVHIINGNGAGNIRTIRAITGDEISFTEPLINVTSGSTVLFYIDTWKEVNTLTKDTETASENYLTSSLGKSANWIKFLVEGRGRVKIPEMRVVNESFKETK